MTTSRTTTIIHPPPRCGPKQLAVRPQACPDNLSGFTLLHLIGVLAIAAILVAILLPALIPESDRLAAEREAAVLKSFKDALQQYIVTTRTIPDQTTWYSAVASQLGINTNDVLYNAHQQAHQDSRRFVIDAALQLGAGSGLPYSQPPYFTNSPQMPMQPVNPRVMIVSSLGKPLPAAVSNGVFNSTYFSNLWTVADGTVPSDTAWSGWNGSPADVKVQRINLGSLFVKLILSTAGFTNSGANGAYYTIDSVTPLVPVRTGIGFYLQGYFIQGSELSLYTSTNTSDLDAKQILDSDSSFYYQQGIWRGSISASVVAGGSNIGDTVLQFLNAAPNMNAANPVGNVQQVAIAKDMLLYMSNYNAWAYTYNFNNAALKSVLRNLQNSMMLDIQGLYVQTSATNNKVGFLPVNNSPCY